MSEYELHIDELIVEISEQLDEGSEIWASVVEEMDIGTDTQINHITHSKEHYTLEERIALVEKYKRSLKATIKSVDAQYERSYDLVKTAETILAAVRRREQNVAKREQGLAQEKQTFTTHKVENPEEHDVARLRSRNADMGKQILALQSRIRELEKLSI